MSSKQHSHKRDFASDTRLLRISLIAVLIGGFGTLAAYTLLNLIRLFTNLFFYQTLSFANRSPADHHLGAWVIVLPVVGGLVVGLIARFGSEKIRGHGIPEAIEAIEAILFGKSKMSAKVAILKPLSSGIVIGSGGPFGAEGPIIMTGGAIGSLIAQHFHLTAAERKTLLVAGATAGMTAVFGTPVAAVLLAVELLLFELRPRSLLPVIVACAVAGFTRPLLLDAGPLFPLQTPEIGLSALFSCVVAGILGGALSALMSTALYRVEDLFGKLPLHWMWWPALGGIAVGIGGYFEPRALGVGYDVIGDLLNGNLALQLALSLLLVKAVIWVIALGSGTSGGVLAPLLIIGAGLGTVLAPWLPGGDVHLWPLVCMAAVLAGVLGAPLTAAVFAFGLTHDTNALLPLLLTTGVAYGVTVLTMRRSIMTEKIARRGYHIYREYGVDPLERQHVDEVMTHAVTAIPASLTIAETLERHFGAQQVHRCYPVVDINQGLMGMVERSSFSPQADGSNALTTLFNPAYLEQSAALVALPSETCRIVAARMATHHLERLPVVSDLQSRRLVGIISRSDLIKPSRLFFDEEQKRERLLS
ncbi:chloride channel protein [Collimonas fungivorans]|uniref:Putative transmembrane protein n=1 Tax=Collimonas fungivorans (strain Ter331) TaxID=1005048 RepID=G0AGQ5_COLFT|nr:chloride channel protein [Collimonas fungivorans]AEK61668.1 putative transmembrane protein [Collimonas fungivorans Ter331]